MNKIEIERNERMKMLSNIDVIRQIQIKNSHNIGRKCANGTHTHALAHSSTMYAAACTHMCTLSGMVVAKYGVSASENKLFPPYIHQLIANISRHIPVNSNEFSSTNEYRTTEIASIRCEMKVFRLSTLSAKINR